MSAVDSKRESAILSPPNSQIVKGKITPAVITFTVMLLVTGTINIIGFKSQSQFYGYKHGFFQSMLMFTGQYLNLIAFNVQMMISPSNRKAHFEELQAEAKENNRKIRVSKFILGCPSFFDTIASSLQNIALLLLPASVTQLLSGGTIIASCIISKIMLNRSIHRHHVLGNVLALIGFTLVALSSLVNDDATERYSVGGEILGIILVLLSLAIQGTQYNLEELIMMKYAVPVQRMVGMEGLLGIIWTFCWAVGLSYFACPNNELCDIKGYLEDPITGLREIMTQPGLAFWCLVCILSVMLFNLSSLNLTKRMSCIYSAFWSATRTLVVWIVSIIVGLETWNWSSSPIQVLGFVFLLVGNLTYNEIIEWKLLGLNKKLQKYQVVKAEPEQTETETYNNVN